MLCAPLQGVNNPDALRIRLALVHPLLASLAVPFAERDNRRRSVSSLDSAIRNQSVLGRDELEIRFQPIVGGVVVGKLLFFVFELPGMTVFEVEVGRSGKLGV